MRGATMTVLLAALLMPGVAAEGVQIVIVNTDGPGEGFNDPTSATPVGGNPGTTIGQQRLNVFEAAAQIWGSMLPSAVIIRVEAKFDALPCAATSGVLGAAAPIEVFRDFPNTPWSGTWYHAALANKLAGADQNASINDITATFNSAIDNNNNCLSGTNWYYGFDGNEGSDVELLPVVLHEIAHGLGFSTFVDLFTGRLLQSLPDIYMRNLYDNAFNQPWTTMNNNRRLNSAKNDGNVVWSGPAATTLSPSMLSGVPVLIVNSPGSLAGTIAVGTASFGPTLSEIGITADLVLVDDGVAPPTDACEPIVNGAAVAGKIAVVDRGTCTFVAKALAAEAAGAVAVILVDNALAATPPGLGGVDPGLSIPMVSVTLADGTALKAELGNGVNGTLILDPNDLAGADHLGRVKMYAPDPVQQGSSISHWDVSAFPDLLMEPFIGNTLSAEVDLTYPMFQDIGWVDNIVAAPELTDGPTRLGANLPNPFNAATSIRFELAAEGPVTLDVFDIAGRRVRRLMDDHLTAGPHDTRWDGRDESGQEVSSGIYLYRLSTREGSESRRMIKIR